MIDLNEGNLDIILGTMFSGKTTYLLSEISKMAELNYKLLYINIDFDNRSSNIYSTHNPFFENHVDFQKKENINKNVLMIKSGSLLNLNIDDKDIIIIDEAHFFDDLVDFVNKCLQQKKYIIVAGLNADFQGRKFGKVLDLIPICTNIKKLHSYCSECAKNKICRFAIYSKKITKSKKNIDIGGCDKYIPVCREHYNEKIELIKIKQNKEIKNSNEKNIEKEEKNIEKEDKNIEKEDKNILIENINFNNKNNDIINIRET